MRKLTMERVHMLLFLLLSVGTGSVWLFLFGDAPGGLDIFTNSGIVRGTSGISRDGRGFFAWKGIPYAKAPVGKLRFEDPQPIGKWTGVWDATSYSCWCAQAYSIVPAIFGSEDCLYLNIYTPKLYGDFTLPSKMPVVFYIHGGAYAFGGGIEQGPDFFMDENVILVTLNYRLGIFGFLSTGDRVVRGNMGLKDQLVALKWVYNNIHHFGGDPYMITLAGESAGGASVVYQMVAQKANGLFHRAMALSGAAGSSWSLISPERMRKKVLEVGKRVDCPTFDTRALVRCLKKLPTLTILQAIKFDSANSYLFSPHLDGEVFVPTVEVVKDDETFLDKNPLEAFRRQEVYQVPMMIGMMADEGLLGSLAFYADTRNMEIFESDMIGGIKKVCALAETTREEEARSNEMARMIRDFYFPPHAYLSLDSKLKQFTKLFSDCFFNYYVHEAAQAYRLYAPVHMYLYTRDKGPSLAPIQVGVRGRIFRIVEGLVSAARFLFLERVVGKRVVHSYGVSHADDVWMMFPLQPLDLFKVDQTHPGYSFSKDFVRLLVEFSMSVEPLMFRGEPFAQAPNTRDCPPILSVNDTPSIIPDPFSKRLHFLSSIGLK